MRICEVIQCRMMEAGIDGVAVTDQERSTLDMEIDDLFAVIAKKPNAQAAEAELLYLGDVQSLLATLSYKFKVPLSSKQRSLVREYDRWDIPDLRVRAFAAIKSGSFPHHPLDLSGLSTGNGNADGEPGSRPR